MFNEHLLSLLSLGFLQQMLFHQSWYVCAFWPYAFVYSTPIFSSCAINDMHISEREENRQIKMSNIQTTMLVPPHFNP